MYILCDYIIYNICGIYIIYIYTFYVDFLKHMIIYKEIDKRFIENRKYYLEKMKCSIDTLDIMQINDNFYNQLKDFYKQLIKP